MKFRKHRILKNGVSLLLLLLSFAAAYKYYAPALSPIRGSTSIERARQIAHRAGETRDYVAVTEARITANRTGAKRVEYVLLFTLSTELVEQAQNGGSSGLGGSSKAVAEVQKAIGELTGAFVELLDLSARYLALSDPTIQSILIQLHNYDGSVINAEADPSQLLSIPSNAGSDAWLEKVSFKPQVIVDGELWAQIEELLNNPSP